MQYTYVIIEILYIPLQWTESLIIIRVKLIWEGDNERQ